MDAMNILPRFKGRVVHDDLPRTFSMIFSTPCAMLII